MRIDAWLQKATKTLRETGVGSPLLEAQVLAAKAMGQSRMWVLIHPEAEITADADQLLDRRANWEPLAYIVGSREFYGLELEINHHVLVPRQDTESVVDEALRVLGGNKSPAILDLCTGSGCIALALKHSLPEASVTASDLSEEALEVARRNGESLGLDVEWIHSDLFQKLPNKKFDLIVTNPPYIARGEVIGKDVAAFEPEIALYAEDTGAEIMQRIAVDAGHHVNPGGFLVVECGLIQTQRFLNLFQASGWKLIEKIGDDGGWWGFSLRSPVR